MENKPLTAKEAREIAQKEYENKEERNQRLMRYIFKKVREKSEEGQVELFIRIAVKDKVTLTMENINRELANLGYRVRSESVAPPVVDGKIYDGKSIEFHIQW